VATGKMYRKFADIYTCGFWHRPMRADRQTNIHADHNTSQPYSRRSKFWDTRERATWRQKTDNSDRSAAERDKSHLAVLCYMPPPPRPRSINLSGTQADTTATGPRAATTIAPDCSAYCCSVDSVGRIAVYQFQDDKFSSIASFVQLLH